MGKDHIYAVTPLPGDALMDRDSVYADSSVYRQSHGVGSHGAGCEDVLIHLLNYVWSNILETSPHVINAFMEANEGMRVASGPTAVLTYCRQDLFQPAKKVREVYWQIHNSLYIESRNALLATYPVHGDEQNMYSRLKLVR